MNGPTLNTMNSSNAMPTIKLPPSANGGSEGFSNTLPPPSPRLTVYIL